MDGNEYRINKFIVGIETEKLLGLSFTGMNTRNNLMTAHLKNQTVDYEAGCMHIILLAEQILELGDTGSMVFDWDLKGNCYINIMEMGLIYCIRNFLDDDNYVGSTTDDLSKRVIKHKWEAKRCPNI